VRAARDTIACSSDGVKSLDIIGMGFAGTGPAGTGTNVEAARVLEVRMMLSQQASCGAYRELHYLQAASGRFSARRPTQWMHTGRAIQALCQKHFLCCTSRM
jgi:hypothetical protein